MGTRTMLYIDQHNVHTVSRRCVRSVRTRKIDRVQRHTYIIVDGVKMYFFKKIMGPAEWVTFVMACYIVRRLFFVCQKSLCNVSNIPQYYIDTRSRMWVCGSFPKWPVFNVPTPDRVRSKRYFWRSQSTSQGYPGCTKRYSEPARP